MNRGATGLWLCLAGMWVTLLTAACFNPGSHPIVFVSEVHGNPEIVLLDPETGRTTRLTNNQGRDFSPRWSPDGEQIVYLTDESGGVELNLRDRKDESTTRLTNQGGGVQSPRWSPDGRRLAFVSEQDGNPEIYVMNSDGSEETRLTFNKVPGHLGDWSPDGEWLVFYSTGPGAESGLWLRNPTGVNLIRLTRGNDSAPAWSPDNQSIAFVRTEEDSQDIYVVEKSPDGAWRGEVEEIRLTRGPGEENSPVWSPDSKSIAFVSFQAGSAEIYTIRADGSQQERLTRNAVDDLSPVWSRDGKQIAFVSRLYGAGEIFVMDADGGRQRRLTNNNAEDLEPDW